MKNFFVHLTWTQYKVAEACKTIHDEICLTASEKLAVSQVKSLFNVKFAQGLRKLRIFISTQT